MSPNSGIALLLFMATAVGSIQSSAVTQTDVVPPTPKPQFPSLKASNLERKAFKLPEDFEGESNLCLIAFQRNQQKNVNTWIAGLKSINTPASMKIYELPTIAKGPRFFTSWLDGQMRAGIHDKQAREMTITLYLNKSAFRKALVIPTEKTISAILIDKKGNVLWRATGDYNEDKGAELMSALKLLGEAAK